MEYPDNRAKLKGSDAAPFAAKTTAAKRGRPPREDFHVKQNEEPAQPVEPVVASVPWNAVPDPKDFEI